MAARYYLFTCFPTWPTVHGEGKAQDRENWPNGQRRLVHDRRLIVECLPCPSVQRDRHGHSKECTKVARTVRWTERRLVRQNDRLKCKKSICMHSTGSPSFIVNWSSCSVGVARRLSAWPAEGHPHLRVLAIEQTNAVNQKRIHTRTCIKIDKVKQGLAWQEQPKPIESKWRTSLCDDQAAFGAHKRTTIKWLSNEKTKNFECNKYTKNAKCIHTHAHTKQNDFEWTLLKCKCEREGSTYRKETENEGSCLEEGDEASFRARCEVCVG